MKNNFYILFLLITLSVSCNKNIGNDTTLSSADLAECIVGDWLSASSDAGSWIIYSFSATNRITAEIYETGRYYSGEGFYHIKDNKLSGSVTVPNGEVFYVDWTVVNCQTFEINYQSYDNNTFIGNNALYRIVSSEEVPVNGKSVPDYRAACGSDRVSDFRSTDNTIASVDPSTGEIQGHKTGVTFISFLTPGGRAVIRTDITSEAKDFAERAIGTWIYDNLDDEEWQRTTFVADGYVHVEWTYADILDENGDGYYTISDDNILSFSITTPEGLQLNQTWTTADINDFIWTYNAYSDGYLAGKYTGQKLLESVTLKCGEKILPEYGELVRGYEITGFFSHRDNLAAVDAETGEITALAEGRTYIDVITRLGAGVIEVNILK